MQIKDKKIVRNGQEGFSTNRACLTNLIDLYDEISGFVDKRRVVDFVDISFSKPSVGSLSPNC